MTEPAPHGVSDAPADTVTVPRSIAEAAIKALRDAKVNAIAFYSDEPYPDDPRWTPWTRFGKPVAERCERSQKALTQALSERDQRYEAADNERLRLREALDNLAHAAREFNTAAAYTVESAAEDEFIAALEAAEALL